MLQCIYAMLQGFRKTDPDRWEFSNDSFVKGQKDQLKDITRRKATAGAHSELTISQNQPAIEIGRYGGLEEQVEHLKRDKNLLMLELVRLRQQQQNTDQETKRLLARLESTEQRQQQMMAFLAKAVQNPAFLQELLTNQRHAQRISGPDKSRKKRRAARGRTDVGDQPYEDPNMQMVLHQPQDSFSQQFVQMLQGPSAENGTRIEEPSTSQTSSPTSQQEGSPEPWEELTSKPRPHFPNEELGTTFSGLKLGLDSRVPSSVTIREHMPATSTQGMSQGVPHMPSIPYADPAAASSSSSAQQAGRPFQSAEMMSSTPILMDSVFTTAQASTAGQETQPMDLPFPGSPFSAEMMQQHVNGLHPVPQPHTNPGSASGSTPPPPSGALPPMSPSDYAPMDLNMMGTTDYLLDQDVSTINSDNFWQQFLTQSPSGMPEQSDQGRHQSTQGQMLPPPPVLTSNGDAADQDRATSLDLLHQEYIPPAKS
ncbi:hypothetical protein ABBQ38_009441 [Trebouxia sp. C0009 RCD-2024]